MKSEAGRRAFIGTLASGAPLLVAVAIRAQGQPDQGSVPDHAAGAADPLLAHVQQQLAMLLRAAQDRGGTLMSEEATAGAAYLRICGVRGRAIGLDGKVQRLARGWVAAVGRDAVIYGSADTTPIGIMLRRRGLDISERLLQAAGRADSAARTAAIDRMLGGRTAIVFEDLAAALDAAAPRLPKADRPVRPVQYSDYEWYCHYMQGQWLQYMAVAYYICSIAQGDPELEQLCETLWSAFMMIDAAYFTYCPGMY